jgi:hypothetical protein
LFSGGNTLLGSAAITALGASGNAFLQIRGSILGAGGNAISASYVGTGNFANSSSSITIDVTASPVVTTLAVYASPGPRASTFLLTVAVKAAGGAAVPTGSVTFARGTTLLGSTVLTEFGTGATGTLILDDGNLAAGSNTIIAIYAGNTAFSRSTASITLSGTHAGLASGRHRGPPGQ